MFLYNEYFKNNQIKDTSSYYQKRLSYNVKNFQNGYLEDQIYIINVKKRNILF